MVENSVDYGNLYYIEMLVNSLTINQKDEIKKSQINKKKHIQFSLVVSDLVLNINIFQGPVTKLNSNSPAHKVERMRSPKNG